MNSKIKTITIGNFDCTFNEETIFEAGMTIKDAFDRTLKILEIREEKFAIRVQTKYESRSKESVFHFDQIKKIEYYSNR